jgi:hypothetical protein
VCKRVVGDGHEVEVTWSGAQTSYPTGPLTGEVTRRTRYFFDVLIDGLYYYGNRFLTSPDAENEVDRNGLPILSRTDLILRLCADRVAWAIEKGSIDDLPNDLGPVTIDDVLAIDGAGLDD